MERGIKWKVQGAYFSRRFSRTPVGNTFNTKDLEPSDEFFAIWLRYNEYRSRTLLNQPYSVLVTTDISNYFESIQHDLLLEYLSPLGLPREVTGLLGRLLETFKPALGHSANPRVGIPVDELDCSRQLAHLFLFEHDRRISDIFGENNYVRWMDDQNIGATSIEEGRRIIYQVTKSLYDQRLTLNSGKTKFLNPIEVQEYFCLDANDIISDYEMNYKIISKVNINSARKDFRKLLKTINLVLESKKGHWDKVLKRCYAIATKLNIKYFEKDAYSHLIEFPGLAGRIFTYFSKRNRTTELLDLFNTYCMLDNNLFEDVEVEFFNSLFFLRPGSQNKQTIVNLCERFSKDIYTGQTHRPLAISSAILGLYWFGYDKSKILNLFDEDTAPTLPKEVVRAWIAVSFAYAPKIANQVIKKTFGHPSDDVLRLVRFLENIDNGTISTIGNYKSQKSRWPLSGKFYDSRAYLMLEIISHSKNSKIKNLLRKEIIQFEKLTTSTIERSILSRIKRRV